jgi:hypothetical protein
VRAADGAAVSASGGRETVAALATDETDSRSAKLAIAAAVRRTGERPDVREVRISTSFRGGARRMWWS